VLSIYGLQNYQYLAESYQHKNDLDLILLQLEF